MVYDLARDRLVLHGGKSMETWEWKNPEWKLVSSQGPREYRGQGMAYDVQLGKFVLFGGESYDPKTGAKTWGDVWTWDGGRWNPVVFQGPPSREETAMAFDPGRGKVVHYGGRGGGVLSDTWEWDGVSWRNKTPSGGGPGPLTGHAMAYDGRGVILFGGSPDAPNKKCRAETWRWDGKAWAWFPLRAPGKILFRHAL